VKPTFYFHLVLRLRMYQTLSPLALWCFCGIVLGRRYSCSSLLSVSTFVTKGGLVMCVCVCVCVYVCVRERENRVLDGRRSSSVVSSEILWSDLHNILTKKYRRIRKTHVEKARAHAHTDTFTCRCCLPVHPERPSCPQPPQMS
jgi:hypothetical protein